MSKDRHFLHGVDYFQLLIDHHGRKLGGPGHIVRLEMLLEGRLEESLLLAAIKNNQGLKELSRVRLSAGKWSGFPRFYFEEASPFPVFFHKNAFDERFEDLPINPFENAPFRLDVFDEKDGNSLLWFSFHHVFFDHIGIQAFISLMDGQNDVPVFDPTPIKMTLSEKLKAYFKAANFAFIDGNFFMTRHEQKLPAVKPKLLNKKRFVFSKKEKEIIEENCKKAGIGQSLNAFLLACVSKALHDEIFSHQKSHNFLWVPSLVNVRQKGAKPYILRNYLSFLFFKIRPYTLEDFNGTIKEVFKQMRWQIGKRLPQAFRDFAETYRFMPMQIYYWMFQMPSMGKLSAFSFSYLGKSFEGLESFSVIGF
ncbi:MAG: hypothetical protein R2784_00970 [Saprospiraceae bacterium]